MEDPLSKHLEIGYQEGRSELNNVIAFLERRRREKPRWPALLTVAPQTQRRWLADPTSPIEHERVTYGELGGQSENAAAGLRELGIAKGDSVFVFVPMSAQLYMAMFAVQRLGAIAVFVDSWANREQLAQCAEQVEPKGIIAPEAALPLLTAAPELGQAPVRVVVGPRKGQDVVSLEELAAEGAACALCPVECKDTALVTFTTGSSGRPKGANRTHRFLAAQHRAHNACTPSTSDDVDLPVFPIFALNNIAGGATTVLPAIDLAHPAATDGTLLVAQLLATNATGCTLSPSLLRGVTQAVQDRGITLPSLRRVTTAGAPISADDVAAFQAAAPGVPLHIVYGSTEVEPISHLAASDMPVGGEGVCVGSPSEALDCRLLRLHRGPIVLGDQGWSEWDAPTGDVGELAVTGEHVCRDYYNNPDAFRTTKILDREGRVWHRTSDLCRVDEHGRIWIVGRVHNAIRRDGRCLFPVEPEIVMKRLDFVEAAAYLGLPDEDLGERAVAAFSVRPGNAPQDFSRAVHSVLASADIIVDDIVEVAEIPLDPRHRSKVEYQKLRESLLERE